MNMWCTWEHFCFSLSRMVCIWDFLSALFALDVLWWWQQLMCSKLKFHYIPCHCCLKEIMLLHGNSATIFCLWYKMLLMFFPTLQITLMSGYIFLLVWHEVSTFCFLREYGSIVQHQYIHLHCILNQVSFHNP
jgi:hypothetical protein